jgi:nucleotide-binding universal stress UspA family protein
MSYKSIVVHLDASERSAARLEIALRLAQHFRAYLIGLYAVLTPEARSIRLLAATPGHSATHAGDREERRLGLERLFHGELARYGISGEWMEAERPPHRAVSRRARCADLIILGQDDPNDPASYIGDHFPETIVMSAGCPVLLIPYAGVFPAIGTHPLVAWDGSREAARAVHDALPFLKAAKQTTILTVNDTSGEPPPGSRIPGADIAAMLARHDVNVSMSAVDGVTMIPIGDMLLTQTANIGADLVVMGGYGHARWRELVLGGATRNMLRSMSVPVLMSH